ncbi:uncharacterized protein BDCG_08132 [Blastomyces dermatitidis ER-3]|uniref:Histone H4 n=1 Tax=Ajellomyces dermatitidis (strain ER-3 / ATCC MYA-2586) TaxID=559297 RepID=A0ABP2EN89_AJEDR|nr:uncharacterized protein BDCG_08132 [Blastomyces dermatitidis ER-3]EEQ84863.1 hypothetical protein BDCG_08132 [Blastomyces dermatitidis ER-3]
MDTIHPHRNLNPKNVARFVPRRLKKCLRDNIMGVTKPAIRRLARRGGVVRMQKDIYDTIRSVILMRLREIIRKLVVLLEGSKYPNKEQHLFLDFILSRYDIANRLYPPLSVKGGVYPARNGESRLRFRIGQDSAWYRRLSIEEPRQRIDSVWKTLALCSDFDDFGALLC